MTSGEERPQGSTDFATATTPAEEGSKAGIATRGPNDRPAGTPVAMSAPPRRTAGRRVAGLLIALVVILGAAWYTLGYQRRPTIALVTSGDGPYWDRVIEGARAAASEYDVDLVVDRVKSDPYAQADAVRSRIAGRLDGIAISPLSAASQANLLGEAAAATTLVTVDSDSPVTGRLLFVGTDNYAAGRDLGALVKQAVPDGGEVVICLGVPDKENTQHRRQGLIDELLDRPYEPMRTPDPVDAVLNGPKYTVAATLVDESDHARATALAADALARYPNVKCFAGLLSYSAPAAAAALQQAGKAQQVRVVGFDADEPTLAGIEAGRIFGTIVQDQYGAGYHAVRVLANQARGMRVALPLFPTYVLPHRTATRDNLAEIRRDLLPGHPWRDAPPATQAVAAGRP